MEETAAMGCCLGGRNFDLTYSPALVVETAPDNGYRSISTVNLAFLGFGEDKLPDTWKQKLIALAAPYAPLDGINEKGLGIAGLNFVGNAVYQDKEPGKDNLAQFELIPYLLGQCSSVQEAKELLQNLNLTKEAFREGMPPSPLHWMLADERQAITIEAVEEGLKIYENPVGVLTNNPPFDKQLFGLNRYLGLSVREPQNTFSKKLELSVYSRGMGAIGLPGDLSSSSRFVRAAFVKMNSLSGETEEESVSQFFHILGSVDQQRGCCEVAEGKYEITQYTSCCNAARGIYYYSTYDNHQITAVDMHREDLEAEKLIRYPKIEGEQIRMQN